MLLNSLFKQWSYRILAPGNLMRSRYEAMKRLLGADIRCHEAMASIQELLHGERREDFCAIRMRINELSSQVLNMIQELDVMVPGKYSSLKEYHKKFDFYTKFLLAPPKCNSAPPYFIALEDIDEASKTVGNKAKNLHLLQKRLGVIVPQGAVIAASAYHAFIVYNKLRSSIDVLLKQVDITSHTSLHSTSKHLMQRIKEGELPAEIKKSLFKIYDHLSSEDESSPLLAVRSCALNEDGEYTFAGQYESKLNVTRANLCERYKDILASKYSPESLYYRISHGVMDEEAAMSVLLQKMVPAEWSGILYTRSFLIDEQSSDNLYLHITGGVGDRLANGEVHPEQLVVGRNNIDSDSIARINTSPLSSDIIQQLLQLGDKIEHFFGQPQDIEWSYTRDDGLYIIQARTLNQLQTMNTSGNTPQEQPLIEGVECASMGVAAGPVFLNDQKIPLEQMVAGSVLVTKNIPAEYTKFLHHISAVIAERGSRASHFATVAREFGVPCLTGVAEIFSRLRKGDIVTVDGGSGKVYPGELKSLLKHRPRLPQTRYHTILQEALSFITPLELVDPSASNFIPEGCRSMHDIIRFCHEKCLLSMFTGAQPGSGRGASKLESNIMLDVYLFDVGGGMIDSPKSRGFRLEDISSVPFHGLWKGLSHQGVQWKQKPFDWEAYDKIELSGGVPPKRDSFTFASYAVVGSDYLHFHIRFGYHFTIVDVLCGDINEENHCMLRFAGGGGDYDSKSLRILFLSSILIDLGFEVSDKGDLLEARLQNLSADELLEKLDYLGRLLGASKLMDMVLEDKEMVERCIADFHKGIYSFSEEG